MDRDVSLAYSYSFRPSRGQPQLLSPTLEPPLQDRKALWANPILTPATAPQCASRT